MKFECNQIILLFQFYVGAIIYIDTLFWVKRIIDDSVLYKCMHNLQTISLLSAFEAIIRKKSDNIFKLFFASYEAVSCK